MIHNKNNNLRMPLDSIVIILALFFFAIRVYFISITSLIDDEAYYAIYARHLSAGYIDHGPGIALFIKWAILLFGENAFGIRFASTFSMSILSYILYIWAKSRFNKMYAFILFSLYSTIFLGFIASITSTPDTPMIFFLMLSFIFYHDAYFVNKTFFYFAGIAFGLAMLSKISVLFAGIAFFLFPFISPSHRSFMKLREYYFSFIIAAIVFSPFILWNMSNNFSFFRYQGGHITRHGSIIDFINLWLAQALLFFPILFSLGIYLSFKFFFASVANCFKIFHKILEKSRSFQHMLQNDFILSKIFFGISGAIPLLYFIIHSFFTKFEVNWPTSAFIGGIFCTSFFFCKKSKTIRILFIIQIIISLIMILCFILQTKDAIFPLSYSTDITNRYYLYATALGDLQQYLLMNKQYGNYRIVSNNYQLSSMINVLIKPQIEALCLSIEYHDTLYSFLYPDSLLIGNNFIYISHGKKFPEGLRKYFSTVSFIQTFPVLRNRKQINTLSIWLVTSYTGKK